LIAQGDEFMTTTETWPGRVALMVAHCAGMVDLVALPIWIGTLIWSIRQSRLTKPARPRPAAAAARS
jgi:hypothetical protein